MAISTYSSPRYSPHSSTGSDSNNKKASLWPKEYCIDNLPHWIYQDNEPPTNVTDCKAKVSALEYTVQDIELQMEIRELELRMGNSRHGSSYDYEKWRIQALKAKQTHYYLLNAHKYWLIKQTPEDLDTHGKLRRLISLLIEDPDDFGTKAQALLN